LIASISSGARCTSSIANNPSWRTKRLGSARAAASVVVSSSVSLLTCAAFHQGMNEGALAGLSRSVDRYHSCVGEGRRRRCREVAFEDTRHTWIFYSDVVGLPGVWWWVCQASGGGFARRLVVGLPAS